MKINFNRFLGKPLEYWMKVINKKIDQNSEDVKHFQFGISFQNGESDFMSAKDETDFYNKLDGMIQSGDDRGRANSITISLLNFKKLNGKGAPLPMPKTVQELKSKKSVITIQDKQCFAKSCLVMYYKENLKNLSL